MKLVAGIGLLGLSLALVLAYRAVGLHVDAQGVLHEPFGLIPLAWLSGLTGAVLVGIAVWRRH
ncbi:MAG: DUF3955 domain-containing protein [Mycobacterium sp.]|nr:DUF3955 domain-containing protein [Mycobacterium sp.]